MKRIAIAWCLVRFTCPDYCGMVNIRAYLDNQLTTQESNSAKIIPDVAGTNGNTTTMYDVLYRTIRPCKTPQ